ncbi:MAG: bifunctional UDP-N-acetylmuramoyl-tripeptide:D-alanyl-D-alanine ligase/alanine racemase [Prevotella sp.]|nr:bifunctional UDP-N-acetylmuramoyl-tripeptide:D-alanyl-D-alanine ligase/alanine racemase [Prevotella sp.]
MTYTIEQITVLIGAHRYGDQNASISFLLTDSRSLCFPEETLFFALHSARNDGHKYIGELYRRGVHNYVVERLPEDLASYVGCNFLLVTDSRRALQRLAERHREEFDIPVIGITGSNGKTMAKEWLYQILSTLPEPEQSLSVTRSPRSYNSQIGVPLSVWLMNDQTQLGIFEAGISERGEMRALRDIIQPTIAVITNLGTAHQENFSSLEEKCAEKMLLFHDAKVIVYNADDDIIRRQADSLSDFKGIRLAWSQKDRSVAMFVKSIEKKPTMTTVLYSYQQGEEEWFSIPFVDDASIQNSIACAVIALYLGVNPDDLDQRMQRLEPVAMRLEVKEGRNGCTLINDSYNSDLKSLDIALDFMQRRTSNTHDPSAVQQPLTLILSDIQQSGLAPDELYARVSELIRSRGITKFIGIGPVLYDQQQQFSEQKSFFFEEVEQFIYSDVFHRLADEVILLKGARHFGFDQITELLVQKVHETTLEVNLKAVVDNLNYYRSFMKADTKLVCMIKADGYGAGAIEIGKTLQDHGVDYLAVAVADEGAALRRAGITANIMVMNPEMSSFKTLFDYDLEPEVYSFRLLDALIAAAEREGITDWPVHIKYDTGMHRLGFNVDDSGLSGTPSDLPRLIARLKHQTAVIPRSVFSHFVGSDSDNFDEFSARQFQLFDKASRQLQAAFGHKILRHIDNSAGIEHFPDRQLDMCRLGLGLYGINPRNNQPLSTVSALKTTILQLRHVPAGDSVGYSRRTVLERDSLIGAIPIGYADGLNRMLGNRRGYCLVGGQRAEYVGNICMDVAMIDVTGIDCHEGDTVEIFGPNLPVTTLSDIIGTIPYEVLTAVSNRVKRIYYQD